MSYDLGDAEALILDAGNQIRRGNGEHGDTEKSFAMIGELWTTYIAHAMTARGDGKLRAHDVAEMMSLVKKARKVYGYSRDNSVDDIGYTSLAGMLSKRPDAQPADPSSFASMVDRIRKHQEDTNEPV